MLGCLVCQCTYSSPWPVHRELQDAEWDLVKWRKSKFGVVKGIKGVAPRDLKEGFEALDLDGGAGWDLLCQVGRTVLYVQTGPLPQRSGVLLSPILPVGKSCRNCQKHTRPKHVPDLQPCVDITSRMVYPRSFCLMSPLPGPALPLRWAIHGSMALRYPTP